MAHIVICLVTKSRFVSEYTFILSCFKNRILKLADMIRFEKLIRKKICNQKDELTFTLL